MTTLESYYFNNIQNSSGVFFRKYVDKLKFKKYKDISDDDKSKFGQNEQIIYTESNCIITCDNICNLSKVYAVVDMLNHNRFLIVISYQDEETSTSYSNGIIIYFDDNNVIKSKNILRYIISSYDSRNGIISKENTFFRNQFVMFIIVHRDNCKTILNVTELDYDDQNKFNCTIYTELKTDYLNMYKHKYKHKLYFNRFITLFDTCCIDISSFKIDKEHDTITFDKIQFESVDANTFESYLSTFNENTYDSNFGDGYPLNCVQCGKITSRITSCSGYTFMCMGSGFCENCLIRYSQSEKKWKCCKKKDDNYCCENIDKDTLCKNDHDDCIYEFNTIKSFKFPFKKEGRLVIKKK